MVYGRVFGLPWKTLNVPGNKREGEAVHVIRSTSVFIWTRHERGLNLEDCCFVDMTGSEKNSMTRSVRVRMELEPLTDREPETAIGSTFATSSIL